VLQREDELLKGARRAADFHGMGLQTPKSARVYGARSSGGGCTKSAQMHFCARSGTARPGVRADWRTGLVQ
jgi:hypothetical protein